MSRRKRRVLLGLTTAAALLSPATAAAAAGSANTTVTFDVTAGTLDITAPATIGLGNVLPGATASGLIGPTVVTDTRGLPTATWTATVSTTTFVNGASTIPLASVTYWSGPTTSSTP